jgi:superfamily II DNA or RNA helicase
LSEAPRKPFKSSIKLWPEQQDVLEFALSVPNAALFCEQRTGKTFVSIAMIEALANDGPFHGVVVSLLNNRDSTWMARTTELIPQVNVTSDWEEYKKLPSPRLLVIHYQMFVKLIKKLVKAKWLTWFCIDEGHGIANRGTKQSRAAARMSWVPRKILLTGTPIEKQPTDLWAQFRFLDPSVFGMNWEDFQKYYMEWPKVDMSHAPPGSALWQQKMLQQRILKNKAKFREELRAEFMDCIKPLSIRLTKRDVGILEPISRKVIVPLTRYQKRVYDEMTRHAVTRLRDDTRILAGLPVTIITKQRQIASGFVFDDDKNVHRIDNAKLNAIKKLVSKLPKPIVIFTAFRPDNAFISQAMIEEGYEVATVTGSTKKQLRPGIWQSFQRGQYDVLVCQTKTGGTGVDLWKSSHAIVASMSHSYRDWDQLKSRMDSRDKSKASELFVICGENTIDEDLFDLVVVKRLDADRVLSLLKQRIKEMAVKTSPKPASTKAETKASTKGAPENKTAAAEPKYAVADLIEATGLVAASVRVALRSLEIPKNFGNKYGWATKTEFDAVVKQLKERSVKAPDALSKDAKAAAPKAAVKAAAPTRAAKSKAA